MLRPARGSSIKSSPLFVTLSAFKIIVARKERSVFRGQACSIRTLSLARETGWRANAMFPRASTHCAPEYAALLPGYIDASVSSGVQRPKNFRTVSFAIFCTNAFVSLSIAQK